MRTSILSLSAASIQMAAFAKAPEGDKAPASDPTPAAESEVAENPAIVPLMDEDKVASIKKLMKSRQTFDSLPDALTALKKVLDGTSNAHGVNVAIHGTNPETGEVDESIYSAPNTKTVLAYVGAKKEAKEGGNTGIKSIVVYAMPTLDAFMATDDGKAWLAKIVEKESAAVAFRNFREVSTRNELFAGVNKAPATAEQYVTEYTRSGGIDTDTFDALWTEIRKAIKKKSPKLSAQLPSKPEIINGIRSKQWAEEMFPALESNGVFVVLANLVIDNAKSNTGTQKDEAGNDVEVAAPMDTTAIDGWLAGRDSFKIETKKSEDFDASLLAGLADL